MKSLKASYVRSAMVVSKSWKVSGSVIAATAASLFSSGKSTTPGLQSTETKIQITNLDTKVSSQLIIKVTFSRVILKSFFSFNQSKSQRLKSYSTNVFKIVFESINYWANFYYQNLFSNFPKKTPWLIVVSWSGKNLVDPPWSGKIWVDPLWSGKI